MMYFCCTEKRRNAVKGRPDLNGIDFLEVRDDPALPNDQRQRTLYVHFLNPLAPGALKQQNVHVEGGERIRDVNVTMVTIDTGGDDHLLTVELDKPGDYSTYTFRLIRDPNAPPDGFDPLPPDGFDPLLSAVDLSFKIECLDDFDCKPERECPPDPRDEPEIDYLARDYNSFRQLMLDRMATIMPQWKERNAADLGIALVELLAYVGDHLSYRQDAIATEAYLGTARRRVSVRRHARLVDYRMHDGCNARAWVQLQVNANGAALTKGTQLLTRVAPQPPLLKPGSQALMAALAAQPEIFETMADVTLYEPHNEINFYTWGEVECCLPRGATRATLRDDATKRLQLCVGDVLIFEERLGPNTGDPDDANPAHRHAVRITRVKPQTKCEIIDGVESRTPSANVFSDPLTGDAIVEIEWAQADALPFPLCLSSKTDSEHGSRDLENVCVALGNIVLADHGQTVTQTFDAMPLPDPDFVRVPAQPLRRCEDDGEQQKERERLQIMPRFHPVLDGRPLTQVGTVLKKGAAQTEAQLLTFDATLPASSAFEWKLAEVLPEISLAPGDWRPKHDLLNSDADKNEFVVEVENGGTAYLRFGDNQHGARPEPGTIFTATYRVGNGVQGNVGADAIFHITSGDDGITAVRNPLPALGGVEPESIEDVRQRAPFAFRTQERAVTADDYAAMTQRDLRVQRAAATFRWTGSWRTAFVTVDRLGGAVVDSDFKKQISDELERYRMAGQDVDVDVPVFVSLEIEMQVCVQPDYFRSDVKQALLDIFNGGILPDGRRGVFHPDNFTFGQSVFLSRLYVAAQAVEGVESVQITKFQRQGTDSTLALDSGKLELGRLEIARLDNDPNFPEHGVFSLKMNGGK